MERSEKWRATEVFSEARDHERGSEDAYLVADHCIAVFDGVSNPDGKKTAGMTPGQFAVETVKRALEQNTDLRAEDAARFATETLRHAVKEQRLEDDMPSLVFVAFFPKQNRIVRVGDCSFLIDGVGHNPGIAPDRAKAEIRRRILDKQLRLGVHEDEIMQNDPSRTRLKDLRIWQHKHANNAESKDLGYGVVNGTDIPEQLVEYISVPEGTRSIILASDGYPTESLRGTLAQTERALVEIQERDPLGISETKSVRANKPRREQGATDDRTYIRIEP